MAQDPWTDKDLQTQLYKLLMGGVFAQPPTAGKDLRNYKFGEWITLPFTASAGRVGRATWSSPTYWCRPDMGDLNTGETFNGLPVWRTATYGAGLSLMVEVFGIANLNRDLTVTAVEFASPQSPVNLRRICQPQDITADIYDGGEVALLQFEPPTGGGGPVTFWRVELTFDQNDGALGDVVLQVRPSFF